MLEDLNVPPLIFDQTEISSLFRNLQKSYDEAFTYNYGVFIFVDSG